MRRVLLALGVLGLLLGLAACGGEPTDRTDPAAYARTEAPAARAEDASEEPLVEVQHVGDVADPVRVEIPSRGIDSTLDRLGVQAGGVLETPPHWDLAGWYDGGPAPGEKGPAVIAGHVDSPTGPAVFAGLAGIGPGERVRVTDADGETHAFEVTRVGTTPRAGFPTQAVYGPVPDAQLRLITCSGAYDAARGGYQDNLLVFATLVRP